MKTEVDCKTINHAYPEHHQVIKEIISKKWSANNKKNKALKRAKYSFDVDNMKKTPNFLKMFSFYNDVIKSAAIEKGKLIRITEFHKLPYHSLMKKGITFIPKSV